MACPQAWPAPTHSLLILLHAPCQRCLPQPLLTPLPHTHTLSPLVALLQETLAQWRGRIVHNSREWERTNRALAGEKEAMVRGWTFASRA